MSETRHNAVLSNLRWCGVKPFIWSGLPRSGERSLPNGRLDEAVEEFGILVWLWISLIGDEFHCTLHGFHCSLYGFHRSLHEFHGEWFSREIVELFGISRVKYLFVY